MADRLLFQQPTNARRQGSVDVANGIVRCLTFCLAACQQINPKITLTDSAMHAVGVQFVLKLMKERPVAVTDNINQKVHNISPTQLGHRIMLSRAALAAGMKKFDFPAYIARTNTEVLRTHLESSSYTSGSYNKADQGRRKRR